MKILMVTNTYTPIIGGVERSIMSFTDQYRKFGHDVLIIAPKFDGMPQDEEGVFRVSALRNFNGSDFSVRIPIPSRLDSVIKNFKPDIVHSHHPFLLGDTALRIAKKYQIPLVFTYHTKYEDYTHYVPGDSPAIKKFVVELATGYSDLADHVFAPSQTIAEMIKARGVTAPVTVIPTGVDYKKLSKGNGQAFRRFHQLDDRAFVIGYVGRLASEKNLIFLSKAVIKFLKENNNVYFLVVGKGPLRDEIKQLFADENLSNRLLMPGPLEDQDLINAYHAMDVFAFASTTETQGIVLTEAMAAGVIVMALDASGSKDIVRDKENGLLLEYEDIDCFVAGLNWIFECSQEKKNELRNNAQKTAEAFSIENTSNKSLQIYKSLIEKNFVFSDIENSPWAAALQRIKTEWELISNVAEAVGSTLPKKDLSEAYNKDFIVQMKRWLNSNEWSARLMGLWQSVNTELSPGLVMIQIDGLAEEHFKAALKKGRMPFLQKLIRKERYQLYSFYSGMPSSTPAVQAELFYGVKSAVPSFSFLDNDNRQIFKMIDQVASVEIESRLKEKGDPLLKGGSSYSNIYSGGAKETNFCSVDLGWDKLWRQVKPVKLFLLGVIHLYSIVRTILRICWELILSVKDFIHGLLKGKNFLKELDFIITRLAICILLRDFITFGVRIDIRRGLPVIHLNFLGYDEHAHRRGPSSNFAYWTLKGIDSCIAKIYKESLKSTRRIYDVWIYSDHGQEDNLSYAKEYKKTVHERLQEIFKDFTLEESSLYPNSLQGIQQQRADYLGSEILRKILKIKPLPDRIIAEDRLVVTGMGPIGHVYIPRLLNEEDKDRFARMMVESADIPLVFSKDSNDRVIAFNKNGKFILPENASDVFGSEHRFLQEVTQDMLRVVNHPNAGTFTICGWRHDSKPYSFPVEGGSHGGPGYHETNGFVLIPSDIFIPQKEKDFLRPIDLRRAALEFLGRFKEKDGIKEIRELKSPSFTKSKILKLRVMTYNVHGCKGMDGKVSPERIARVIARHSPDIIALQELDINRMRSAGMDQPHTIAQQLKMVHHFHAALKIEEEQYGNAVLSRFPMRIIQAQALPTVEKKRPLEPRGALWVEINIHGTKLQFINTHFGLSKHERFYQAEAIIGPSWLSHPQCAGPVILSGDFNALGNSKVCQMIQGKMNDVQIQMENHRPQATWFGFFPFGRIDHIFINDKIKVKHIEVSRTGLDQIASDHLPLIADLQIEEV